MRGRNLNWNDIRPINNSLNEGFEELVCQLARIENIDNVGSFIRKGKPDAGVECFYILESGKEIAWQAKFFTNSFDSSQWNQVDRSVNTALEKHPNLSKLILAFPVDPSDARVENQKTMLDKWNDRKASWKQKSQSLGMSVEFEAWWSSDLIYRIQNADHGLLYFWFNKDSFTDDWFRKQNSLAIADLGQRYTPELNLKLPISDIFNGVDRNELFQQNFNDIWCELSRSARTLLNQLKAEYVDSNVSAIEQSLCQLTEILDIYRPIGIVQFPILDAVKLLDTIFDESYRILGEIEYGYKNYIIHNKIREFNKIVRDTKEFIASTTVKLSNNPYLLLTGVAGCGKSHLLADVVSQRMDNGFCSLFLLGSYFSEDKDPFLQMIEQCGVRCDINEFLYSLNTKAQILQKRIVIFIDAANEGGGKNLWGTYINSFIKRLRDYEWIGLVISTRTTYVNYMFPQETISSTRLIKHEHKGFDEATYDAVKLFFDAYGIEHINSPLLVPEFSNPLFLSLFCKGLSRMGYKSVPAGITGISSILNLYVKGVNLEISAPGKLDYDSELNLVGEVIKELSVAKIKNRCLPLTIKDAHKIIHSVSVQYGIKQGLYNYLLDEHIISKDFGGLSNDIVEITYERLQDYYSACYIVDTITDLHSAFKDGGEYHFLFANSRRDFLTAGVVEALSIILPERKGVELYEVVPRMDSFAIAYAFLDSLLWRDSSTICVDKIKYFVNNVVLKYEYTAELLWDVVLQVSAIPNHPLNAIWLDKHLNNFSMADRDAWWTQWLKKHYYPNTTIDKIIQWGYNANCSDKTTIKLICITLAWFHTSTNRELRDRSTKAMICLLSDNIDVLIEVLKLFENVNDPYVYERLYAVAYGTVLKNKYDSFQYAQLVNYIYSSIFAKDEVYPHILLRDYARNIIEYYVYLGNSVEFNVDSIRPPYKSWLPETGPTNEELDRKYEPNDIPDTERYRYAASRILASMTTEYGRGCCGYGDFGRYTFQSALSQWQVDYDMLSNIAVEWIFEKYGYDVNKHGQFDIELDYNGGRRPHTNERIGKKYQWIAFYELLARVSDNCTLLEDRWNEESVIPYNGPWCPYVRDIDPSLIIRKKQSILADMGEAWMLENVNIENDNYNYEWVKDASDIPNPATRIEYQDKNGICWLALVNYPEWKDREKYNESSNEPYKLLWQQIRSYIIDEDKYEEFLDWANKQDFTGRWMPEPDSIYELYEREYYWSPAYKDVSLSREIRNVYEQKDRFQGSPLFNVYLTYVEYLWESERDCSKEEAISFSKPSQLLFNGLKMRFTDKAGIWVDNTGKVICFNASVWHGTKDVILIRKDVLLQFLKENHLRIIWTVIGEKNIIRDNLRSSDYDPIEISGCYYLDEGQNIQGEYNVYSIREKEVAARKQDIDTDFVPFDFDIEEVNREE